MSGSRGARTFSLLGGPLHRLGRRLGLVRGGTNTLRLGCSLGAGLWLVLATLALLEGVAPAMLSLSTIGAHVRLLAVIPLLFLCETWVAPRAETFVDMILRSGIVPTTSRPALEREITRTVRLANSSVAEAICALAAVALSLSAQQWSWPGTAEAVELIRSPFGAGRAGQWYAFVCLPVFRFVLMRWLWRLVLWAHFLSRVATLELHLVPTHPDGAGGLGYLEVVHTHFILLVLALSALEAAALCEELAAGAIPFATVYPALAAVLLVDALLFLGPLFLVTPKLWACRVKGLSDYMMLAQRYVSDFDGKWLGGNNAEPLLGTPDMQSLADLSNSVNVVRNMRIVPISLRLVIGLALAAALPMLPLFLFEYPLAELAQKFVARLLGL